MWLDIRTGIALRRTRIRFEPLMSHCGPLTPEGGLCGLIWAFRHATTRVLASLWVDYSITLPHIPHIHGNGSLSIPSPHVSHRTRQPVSISLLHFDLSSKISLATTSVGNLDNRCSCFLIGSNHLHIPQKSHSNYDTAFVLPHTYPRCSRKVRPSTFDTDSICSRLSQTFSISILQDMVCVKYLFTYLFRKKLSKCLTNLQKCGILIGE